MAGFNFFNFGIKNTGGPEFGVPSAFIFGILEPDFIRSDLELTYTKILTDTFERLHGLSDDIMPVLWDSCVQSEASKGLITLLAWAMTQTNDLFLVYNKSVGVIRQATTQEAAVIRADYEKESKSSIGVFVSFRRFHITPMLRIYSALEHAQLASLYKTTNLSKAAQYKISDMRASVSLTDSGPAIEQARAIAHALASGQDVLLDAKDSIETAVPNLEATKNAIAFLQAKRAYILNAPVAYVTGEQTAGLGGGTGEADMRAIERCLKGFFASIAKPICKALFDVDVEFRSMDFADITNGLEVLRTFDLVTDENMSRETKQEIVARFFDLDVDKERARIEAEAKANPPITPPSISVPTISSTTPPPSSAPQRTLGAKPSAAAE